MINTRLSQGFRSVPGFHIMQRLPYLVALLMVVSLNSSLSAQGPRFEEEEGDAAPNVPERLDEPMPMVEPLADAETIDLAQEATTTQIPILQGMFTQFATPYDQMRYLSGRTESIVPIPLHWGDIKEPTLTVASFGENRKPGPPHPIQAAALERITPYEELALTDVAEFLALDLSTSESLANRMSRREQYDAARKVLTAVAIFHRNAIATKKRTGATWARLGERLDSRLRQVRLEHFRLLIEGQDWEQAEDQALRLGIDYPLDEEVTRGIYQLAVAKLHATATTLDELRELRDALNKYRRDPGVAPNDPLIALAQEKLANRAKALVEEANQYDRQTQGALIQQKLLEAESLAPDQAEVRGLRNNLAVNYRPLYVGMAGLPMNMSPARAWTDPERRAVELIFEPLLRAVPDQRLGRLYDPILAESLPILAPRGREFRLITGARWTTPPHLNPIEPEYQEFDAGDVRATLELLRQRPETWAAQQANVLEGVGGIDFTDSVTLVLKHGYLDPLAAMDFKILPGRWMTRHGLTPFDDRFAQAPVGTGPYRYVGRNRDSFDREAVVFQINPFYAARAGESTAPQVQEIRFFDATQISNPALAFEEKQLHLLLDVPTQQLAGIRAANNPLLRIHQVSQHRRIHFLGVNHRNRFLRDRDLRRGLSAAIDRDHILGQAAFGGINDTPLYHREMTGPFPPNCWAAPPNQPSFHDAELARTLMDNFVAAHGPQRFKLLYSAGDPEADVACIEIRDQVANLSNNEVTLDLEALAPAELYQRVVQEKAYDLVYWHFDYDELFRLDGLLDADAAVTGGRNFLHYLAPGSDPTSEDLRLQQLLRTVPVQREFPKLREQLAAIHTLFNQQLPFIPLWHLDQHFVVHVNVEIRLGGRGQPDLAQLDLSRFFLNVPAWGLK